MSRHYIVTVKRDDGQDTKLSVDALVTGHRVEILYARHYNSRDEVNLGKCEKLPDGSWGRADDGDWTAQERLRLYEAIRVKEVVV